MDLTRVWAGPVGTRLLADLGADVIKVEAATGRGPAHPPPRPGGGQYADGDPGERPWNRQGSFNKLNRNKRSVVLDLKTEAGKALFLRLVAVSDVVIDNFSAGTLDDLGVGYERQAAVQPAIVYVEMPGFGTYGPYRDYVAYGPSIEPMTAYPFAFGYGDGPHVTALALPDATAGTVAASAVLAALWRRDRTGRGAHVDVSQFEGFFPFFTGALLAAQEAGQTFVAPPSNRHPEYAPHGIYRCLGDDDWIAIATRSETEWISLCRVAGLRWERDARFHDLASRREHQDTLDAAVESWTAEQSRDDLARRLLAAGVPAGAVLDAPGLLAEPHLNAREYFVHLDHPDVGLRPYPGSGVKVDGRRHEGWRSAPTLGEHNESILSELGLSAAEVARLYTDRIIANRPPDAAREAP